MFLCSYFISNRNLGRAKKLTMQDLNGECVVMPIEGVSEEIDAFRQEIRENYPTIQIVNSSYYGVDTFTMCEMNRYILITQPVYADIHTNLITIPLETDYTLPYGLIYANEPTTATKNLLLLQERSRKPNAFSDVRQTERAHDRQS